MISSHTLNNIISAKILSSTDFKSGLQELVSSVGFSNGEEEAIINDIMLREERFSTYFMDEVVVPSSQIKTDDLYLIAGVGKNPIRKEIAEQSDMRVIFLILYGEKRKSEYLNLLAYIYRIVSSRQLKNKLISCERENEIKEQLIKGIREIET